MGTFQRRCVYAFVFGFLRAAATAASDAFSAVSRSDRGALQLLYWATNGRAWNNGWDIQNEMSDPCLDQWYGITCDDAFHIVAIRLPGNNLAGYVPVEFPRATLRFLQELDLSSNFLTGSVPSTLARFAQLRVLRLDRNWFDGALPASLGTLAFLEYLEVQGNLFSVGTNGYTIPDAVAALAQSGQCHIIS